MAGFGVDDALSGGAVAKAWATVRTHLRESAGTRLFDQWLKPMELVAGSDVESIRLALPSAFMTNWVRNHYADRLLQEFRGILPGVTSVAIETRSAAPAPKVLSVEAPAAVAPAPRAATAKAPPAFDTRFTFDHFVVDHSNRVAFNAAKALAEPGKPRFSPLFLHSGTGQGKTHLMHAIGAAYLAAVPDANVIMMSAERFMFEFVQAVRARAQRQSDQDTHAFKTRLRAADLLMIDDLQFIAGKDSTQEEFFHTINEVMASGKRLVISADRCPQGLDGVEARIVSRLSVGLVADIKAPDLALRRAVLDRKLADLPDVSVPEEVLDILASRITVSIRDLEGALNRVIAYAQLTGETITLDFAIATLGDALRGAERRVTIDEIQKAVSTHFALKPVDLISARRAVVVARPRQIAMYLAKRLTTRSLPEIGRKFGGRDHSTVIHAVRRIEELRDTDRELDGAVRTLLRELEG
ncbi:MAG: chromosomal replication initiator protein DnaA [Sphingomonas bacterium]|uniref:chromosomal replication initiator protein DnaA n=1 Tax=Sphingomonas bacterium TaxID=1895847 RepID=UPI00261201BF|nr:chromosomal replication initiator protein DnaA [Sphingomonas bacterium]MDB5711517.1 chromosomal replication initiator protein DnaA [Sphingomonas bacterium]